ncbi:hypothetical protein PFISCL1PPCAC_12389, partial [Pristionchus fissidentatus]
MLFVRKENYPAIPELSFGISFVIDDRIYLFNFEEDTLHSMDTEHFAIAEIPIIDNEDFRTDTIDDEP